MYKKEAIPLKPVATSDDYIDLIQKFSWLVEQEIDRRSNGTPQNIAGSLPSLISMVNVIGYFRGQNSAFFDIRPMSITTKIDGKPVTSQTLYGNEDYFEEKLRALIQTLANDEELKNYYHDKLQQYYVTERSCKDE